MSDPVDRMFGGTVTSPGFVKASEDLFDAP